MTLAAILEVQIAWEHKDYHSPTSLVSGRSRFLDAATARESVKFALRSHPYFIIKDQNRKTPGIFSHWLGVRASRRSRFSLK
jgi:hypothetical protein